MPWQHSSFTAFRVALGGGGPVRGSDSLARGSGPRFDPQGIREGAEALLIRYGRDLDDTEVASAMSRIASTELIDENWFWDITWCPGRKVEGEPVRGPTGKKLPDLGSTILV
mmetsp:Transcript_29181/g.54698  ORF Transcript_29181/g.54698 Transcript_29181/m.54698 type:complete len:112 (+) Transcript_29181:401-736(+)